MFRHPRGLPPTVFVTAHQLHAVRSFNIAALDYITKPVSADRLALTLERVRHKMAADSALLTQKQFTAILKELGKPSRDSSTYQTRLLVLDGDREIILNVESVAWIEAAAYYSCLHVQGCRWMLRQSISVLSARLNPNQFVRVHRSAIVNLAYVQEIFRDGTNDGVIVLKEGKRIKISRAGRQKLADLNLIA